MEVEDHRDQGDGEHEAGGDPPAQLEPHGVEVDLPADPLALDVAAIEVVRENRDQRAQQQLNHRSSPACGGSVEDPGSRAASGAVDGGSACIGSRGRSSARSPASCGLRSRAIFSSDWAIDAIGVEKSGICDESKQQGRDPEDMVVGEQRDQREHRHDLHLHLVGPVRHPLRQRMKAKIEVADEKDVAISRTMVTTNRTVGLARAGDEDRQMSARGWMCLFQVSNPRAGTLHSDTKQENCLLGSLSGQPQTVTPSVTSSALQHPRAIERGS